MRLIRYRRAGPRGTRADQGVCPTTASESPVFGKLSGIGLSVCRADTLVGALRPEGVRVETSLDPAGKSACATSASCRINDLEKRLQGGASTNAELAAERFLAVAARLPMFARFDEHATC